MINSCVVLGDCKSNGLNTMAWKTCKDLDIVVDVSLQFSKVTKPIIEWYLQERKRGVYSGPMGSVNYLQHIALKNYVTYEKQFGWPSYLNASNVYNLSKTGTTFQGYLADIKKHIAEHGKPDCVCVTDFTDDHVYVRTNHDGVKHSGPIFQSLLNSNYDPNVHPYSETIYNKRKEYGKNEIARGQEYLNRKNNHSFYFLTNFLERNNIPYFFVRFRETNSDKLFQKGPTLDLSAIHNMYMTDQGEHSLKLYSFQQTIAEFVNEYMVNLRV